MAGRGGDATWPGEAEVRLWQLADEHLWTLAAETVARELVLLWPTLAWPSGAPAVTVSTEPDWRLPAPRMLRVTSAALGVALSELRIVGTTLEREAVQAVGASGLALLPRCFAASCKGEHRRGCQRTL